jgi:outer membrane protein OmpA-like peptidoglycan-associated protein
LLWYERSARRIFRRSTLFTFNKGYAMTNYISQKASIAVVTASLLLGACATGGTNGSTVGNTGIDRNTAIGAGSGAVLGGILGAVVSSNGNKNEGALLGAALGGVLGGVVGNNYGDQIQQKLNNLFKGSDSSATQMSDGSLKINLAGDVSFSSGSSVIKDSFVGTLNEVATIINQTPNRRVVVVGHTDSMGNADANQRLSLARANSVRNFLVNNGTSSSRISTDGRGSTQSVASNNTEEGRAQNRRVEIFLLPENQ